ncbi:DUF4081 domain-containing GNAT family N-acetyltransferase [Acidipropionibacterium virtanenii]|uniref:Mycothiol acetyltransferase n=1 Tax=Acidipropionibacterium virtanenii TaxID=2057246 RepID=A0A344UT73_9ACTN|nr:DUF4081 domain-containing GNAT family N-acetyltransferase [Acidipropionibacterium virtanenii]AXE38471.1 Mycothiol acetyltransferase [Acidipropionibacterium virtanenii]
MGTRIRVLDDTDLPAARELASADPLTNVFLLSRMSEGGLDRSRLGCPVHGAWQGRELVGMLHAGANLVPCGEPGAVAQLASHVGPWRRSSSIMGRSDLVMGLHAELSRRWGHPWSRTREIRAHQPLLVLDGEPAITPDPRVRRIDDADFDSYFRAAVAMYTEEVGVSPIDPTHSYRRHMRQLVRRGQCFGIVEDGQVRWKSDIGVAWRDVCQIQGVWLDPALRGHGASARAMAGVARLCRRRHSTVSLYVNDFNTRALRMYRQVGFRDAGEMATVLY